MSKRANVVRIVTETTGGPWKNLPLKVGETRRVSVCVGSDDVAELTVAELSDGTVLVSLTECGSRTDFLRKWRTEQRGWIANRTRGFRLKAGAR